jgi:hypothetical protein
LIDFKTALKMAARKPGMPPALIFGLFPDKLMMKTPSTAHLVIVLYHSLKELREWARKLRALHWKDDQ